MQSMRRITSFERFLLVLAPVVFALITAGCQTKKEEPPPPEAKETEDVFADLPDGWRRAIDSVRRSRGKTEPLTRKELRERFDRKLTQLVEREMGPPMAPEATTIEVEATDDSGEAIAIPFTVEGRPLRRISEPALAEKALGILDTPQLVPVLYGGLPETVVASKAVYFTRTYVGEAARAIRTEAKVVVGLKGGVWSEGEGIVANAVAVRGLDLTDGLRKNSNKTYDDTVFIVVDRAGDNTEVFEYRMTTESSREKTGTGRLSSRQVHYVRGKHRGKDPAYRLQGNAAEGTRHGMTGSHQIIGANIHSAYSSRTFDSTTPLRENVSLGCQAIATSKSQFEKQFVFRLDKIGVKEFPYTIVDGDELVVLDKALRKQQKQSVLVHRIARQ
jgi:hypothetical protein